jgi:hypothetical protein
MFCSSRGLRQREREKGSALLEFLLCAAFLWIPLFLGVSQYGLALIQAIRASAVCRDAGRMFAYGIDFSQSGNQYLLAGTAPSLNIDPTGAAGTGVAIFSTVQYVTAAQCSAGGYSNTCPNNGQLVFIRQIIVGNAAIHVSAYGTPTTDSTGTVAAGSPLSNGYLNQASALVHGFPNITLSAGTSGQQYAYICEIYARSPGLTWFSPANNWVSERSFF